MSVYSQIRLVKLDSNFWDHSKSLGGLDCVLLSKRHIKAKTTENLTMLQIMDNESWSSVNTEYFISVDIQQEMRAAFENEAQQSNRPRLLMTAAVSAGMSTIESAYQVPRLAQ